MIFAQEQNLSLAKDLVSYGALGLVVLAMLTGWLWAKPAVDQILAKLTRAEAKLDANDAFTRDVVLPALSDSNEMLRRVTEFLWKQGREP